MLAGATQFAITLMREIIFSNRDSWLVCNRLKPRLQQDT